MFEKLGAALFRNLFRAGLGVALTTMFGCAEDVRKLEYAHYHFELAMASDVIDMEMDVHPWIVPERPIPIRQGLELGDVYIVGEATYENVGSQFRLIVEEIETGLQADFKLIQRPCSFRVAVGEVSEIAKSIQNKFSKELILTWPFRPVSEVGVQELELPHPISECSSRMSSTLILEVAANQQRPQLQVEFLLGMAENGITVEQLPY